MARVRRQLRVIDWIIRRIEGKVPAIDSPIGRLPQTSDMNLDGIDVPQEDLDALFEIASGTVAARDRPRSSTAPSTARSRRRSTPSSRPCATEAEGRPGGLTRLPAFRPTLFRPLRRGDLVATAGVVLFRQSMSQKWSFSEHRNRPLRDMDGCP
ncbi:MAG: phosphoenolpyruvate carboxykinase domain-containing protein [Microbacterium sp.]